MKYLCVPEEYESEGKKKTKWNRIGVLFDGKNGKQYVKLYFLPNTLIHVYEEQIKPKTDNFGADLEVPF